MAYGRIIVPVADVRTQPIFESERKTQQLFNDLVEIRGTYDKYVWVRFPGDEGWIRSTHLEIITTLVEHDHYVNAPVAQIFEDDRTTLQTRLAFGTQVTPIERAGDMAKIATPNGLTGWVRLTDLSDFAATAYSPARALEIATGFLGTPYVWGGITPFGVDCSGMVIAIGRIFGAAYPHSTKKMAQLGDDLDFTDAKPMDLLFFPGHVALYLGDNKILHSTTRSGGCLIDSIDPQDPHHNPVINDLYAVRRFWTAPMQP